MLAWREVATLVYRPGEPDERSFAIGDAALSLGRGLEQDIAIPHKSLSRRHALVEPAGGRYFIVDLGSKNGTFVNGAREQRRELRHGDTVTLGEIDLLFLGEPSVTTRARPIAAQTPQPNATVPLLRSRLAKLAADPAVRELPLSGTEPESDSDGGQARRADEEAPRVDAASTQRPRSATPPAGSAR